MEPCWTIPDVFVLVSANIIDANNFSATCKMFNQFQIDFQITAKVRAGPKWWTAGARTTCPV
jgi:hypothetical protein